MKTKPPCKDCKDRELGCHSTCERYLNFKVQNEKYREWDRQDRQVKLAYNHTMHRQHYKTDGRDPE